MNDFVDTSALLTENKMNGLGLDIARLSSTTSGLMSENKTMTIMICILVLIIIVLLVIMYRVYTYTSSVEDLIYGRSWGGDRSSLIPWGRRSHGGERRRAVVVRKSRPRHFDSGDSSSDWDDSDWEDEYHSGRW